MNWITTIIHAANATFTVAKTSWAVYEWVSKFIGDRLGAADEKSVAQFLEQFANASEREIRRLVDECFTPQSLQPTHREELIIALVRLSQISKNQGSAAKQTSSYLRCKELIASLLAGLKPKRRPGETVGPGWSDWKLKRFLGMGTFGEVWMGESVMMPHPYAFKFFVTDEGKSWLIQEQQALFQVKQRLPRSPNLIQLDNVVVGDQKYPFLVLEYAGGGSLEHWLENANDPRNLDVAEVMAGLARGLAAAHRKEIYHRDLKPANILLTDEGEPKISDFGLASLGRDVAGSSVASASKPVPAGTYAYMPPETHYSSKEYDEAKHDVFSFGVIWYQLLTRSLLRPPYDFADQLAEGGVDRQTIHLISRCLAQPSRRFSDGQELLHALSREAAPVEWSVPEDCYDVGKLASAYLNSLTA